MSVDDRLREAFGETDPRWDEGVPTALAALRARRRRENVVRGGAAAGLVAAAAVVVVAVASPGGDKHPVPSEVPSSPATSTTALPAEVPAALTGGWVSRPVTSADVRRAARAAGDPDKAALMLNDLPATPFRIVLFINGARHEIHQSVRSGGVTETYDQENIEVRADELVLTPQFADGENIHSWVIEDGVLEMDFVSTTELDTQVVPAEAWQQLFFDTVAFTRMR
jgi:hypothetical protein